MLCYGTPKMECEIASVVSGMDGSCLFIVQRWLVRRKGIAPVQLISAHAHFISMNWQEREQKLRDLFLHEDLDLRNCAYFFASRSAFSFDHAASFSWIPFCSLNICEFDANCAHSSRRMPFGSKK